MQALSVFVEQLDFIAGDYCDLVVMEKVDAFCVLENSGYVRCNEVFSAAVTDYERAVFSDGDEFVRFFFSDDSERIRAFHHFESALQSDH